MALQVLAQLGFEGEAAEDGSSALAAHRMRRFDLILMDCEMPVLDGYAATRRLRAEENRLRTPVLALSADGGTEREMYCRRAGMDGLLTKPLRAAALRAALQRWLNRTDDAAPSSPMQPDDELEAVRAAFGVEFPTFARLYQRDGQPRMAALRQAHAHGDRAQLAKAAHMLGGSSASIGATGLARQCLELETCAKAGSLDDAARRVAAIEAEFLRVIGKLQALLVQ